MCRRDDYPPHDHPDDILQSSGMFRRLDPSEESSFRAWARANWQVGQSVNPLWHPVVRDECERIARLDETRQEGER